ncbi:hypothetical protein [Microcystis aeruginosa]|nr:hypothetical protein [Microcystis aeruginosa]
MKPNTRSCYATTNPSYKNCASLLSLTNEVISYQLSVISYRYS